METQNQPTTDSNAPNPQGLDKLANQAKEQAGTGTFMQPGTKIRKGPGRPSNAEKAKKAQDQKAQALGGPAKPAGGPEVPPEIKALSQIPSKEIARPLVSLVSNLGVSYVGDPRAAMKPDELEAGSQALGLLIDKYMPDVIGKYGIEAMCLLVFGQYGLRVISMKKYLDEERRLMEKMKNEPVRQKAETQNGSDEIPIFPQTTEKEGFQN